MIRRFFTRILIFVLLAICGYNGWQAHQLQGENVRLHAQMASLQKQASARGEAAPTVAAAAPPQNWLARADSHAARARVALSRGDFGTAHRELTQSVGLVRRAAAEPGMKTRHAMASTRARLSVLQAQADTLWRKARGISGRLTP